MNPIDRATNATRSLTQAYQRATLSAQELRAVMGRRQKDVNRKITITPRGPASKKAPWLHSARNSSLGQFLRSRERLVFTSCNAAMIDDPVSVSLVGYLHGVIHPQVPYVTKGVSYRRSVQP